MESTRAVTQESGFTDEYKAERQDALFYTTLAFVLSVAETLVFYLVISSLYQAPPLASFLGQASDVGLPWVAAVVLSRGPLQPLNLCIFGFGANLLMLRLWIMRGEFRAFNQPYLVGIPTGHTNHVVITEESRHIPLLNIQRIAKDYTGSRPLLVRRMEVGSRRLDEQGDATQVHVVMKEVAEIDRETLESRYTLIRYLVWLIPTIGFLGTVVGIGRAISGFNGFLSRIGAGEVDFQTQLQPVLGEVSGKLGVAFDVTALALLLSAIIVALTSVVQTREEGLLTTIDEFCLRFFVSRIRVADLASKQMGEMLSEAMTSIMQAVMSQRPDPGDENSLSLRDVLGRLDAQDSRLSDMRSTQSDALMSLKQAAQSIAASAEQIRKSLERT